MVIFQKAPPPKPQNLVEKTGPWNINNYAIKSCTRRLEICSMQVHWRSENKLVFTFNQLQFQTGFRCEVSMEFPIFIF